jgi:FkbM family methyltransferase
MPEHWLKFKSSLIIDAFDPDIDAEDKGYKKENNVTWFSSGLAGKTGESKFYITNIPSGSSLYQPNPITLSKYSPHRYWKIREVKDLFFMSFDDFLTKNKRNAPDLVKLDTQGSELDILQSLKKKQLLEILAIEVEVEFLELYCKQPLFRDIDKYLSLNGFELFDLRTHRSYRCIDEDRGKYSKEHFKISSFPESFSAKIIAGDAIYIKKLSGKAAKDKVKILKIIKILIIYNFFDESLALVYENFEKGIFNKDEKNKYIDEIKVLAPNFSNIHKKNSLLRKFLLLLRIILKKFITIRGKGSLKGWSKRVWPNQ